MRLQAGSAGYESGPDNTRKRARCAAALRQSETRSKELRSWAERAACSNCWTSTDHCTGTAVGSETDQLFYTIFILVRAILSQAARSEIATESEKRA
ncbi:hypothetical protein RRG08_007504 [Elysia crispata]|uniref:Uncharacterized protein n=1 Tax=Elysia crispata TaxID=231223 RepID=A0AAE1DFY3_9GAST|nr:hypothetical protein RRG08_007504 [Elysia crispata]